MKKLLLTSLLCCLAGSLHAQVSCNIDFTLVNYPDSVLYIKGNYGNKPLNIDTLHRNKAHTFHLRKTLRKGIYRANNGTLDLFSFVVNEDSIFSLTMYSSGRGEVLHSMENALFIQFQYVVNMSSVQEYQLKKALQQTSEKNRKALLLHSLDSLNKAITGYEFEFFKMHPNHVATQMMLFLQDPPIPPDFQNPANQQSDTAKAQDYLLYLREHYWDNVPLENEFWLRTPYFHPKFKAYINELAAPRADSVYANLKQFLNQCRKRHAHAAYRYAIEYYLEYLFPRPISFDEIMYVKLIDDFVNADKAEWMPISEIQKHKKHADEVRKFLPGQKAKKLVLKDPENNTHSLPNTKHRYMLLMIWSHECSHCMKELPSLLSFYEQHHEDLDLEIFAVEVGNNPAEWKKHIQENPMPWVNVYAEHPLSQYDYPMVQTPDFYLINQKGEIISHTVLYPHLLQILKQLAENKK